ncbi:MAG: 30S ribosomal protein S3ae [Sulfolobales archaeon]
MSSRMRISGREKWKYKKWYRVIAPPTFGEIEIGTIPGDEDWKVIGRTIEVPLYDVTGDISQLHIRFRFQITSIDGDRALTSFRMMELARDYLRSLTRRKTSKVAGIVNLVTKDGYKIRVTGVVFTTYKCKTSQKKLIRKKIFEILEKEASEKTLDEFIKASLGEIQNLIFQEAKKIYPIRKVEIAKIKLLSTPPRTQKEEETETSAEAVAQ